MTLEGWPSAVARLTSRPSPSRLTRLPLLQREFLDAGTDDAPLPAQFFQGREYPISTLKWPELQTMAPSFIDGEVFAADDVDVAGDGHEEVADWRRLFHRHDSEAVHHALPGPLTGSISVTMTSAPMPLARMAMPRPHQP